MARILAADRPDYLVRVAVADLPACETVLSSRVITIPGVSRVHRRFAMKNIKGAVADPWFQSAEQR